MAGLLGKLRGDLVYYYPADTPHDADPAFYDAFHVYGPITDEQIAAFAAQLQDVQPEDIAFFFDRDADNGDDTDDD